MPSDVQPALGAARSRFSAKHDPVAATKNISESTSQRQITRQMQIHARRASALRMLPSKIPRSSSSHLSL
eukprot:13319390-Alexandrium_andersonii.AAC.1